MKAKDFDKSFNEGVDITKGLDTFNAKRVKQEQKRIAKAATVSLHYRQALKGKKFANSATLLRDDRIR